MLIPEYSTAALVKALDRFHTDANPSSAEDLWTIAAICNNRGLISVERLYEVFLEIDHDDLQWLP